MALTRKIVLLVTGTFIFLTVSFSQTTGHPVFKQVTHPFMPPITSEYFFFSEDGLMWFSTAQGLTSFDGSEILYYSSQAESEKYGLHRITSMTEDSDNNLYLGNGNGVCIFNRSERRFFSPQYPFSDNNKTKTFHTNIIFIDKAGTIFIGSSYRGLFIYERATQKLLHFNIEPSKPDSWSDGPMNSIASIAAHATDNNKLWMGTGRGIYLFDKTTRQFSRNFEITNPGAYKYGGALPENFDVQKMDVENDSIIWFNSYTRGFCRYNSRTGKVKVFLHNAIHGGVHWVGYIIRNFARAGNGNYILAIDDPHPGIFNTKTETLELIKIFPPPVLFDRTRFALNDKHGNIWLLNKGQFFVSIPDFYRLKRVALNQGPPADLRYNNTYDIHFDKATQTYFAGGRTIDGARLFSSDLKEIAVIPSPTITNYFLRKNSITDHVTRDSSGRYWTTGLQTCVLLPGKKKLEGVENVFPSLAWLQKKEFSDILTTRNGDVALRQFSNGTIYIINHKTLEADTFFIPKFNPAINYELNCYFADYDSSRNLLYTSNHNGLARLNLSNGNTDTISGFTLLHGTNQPFSYFKFRLDHKGRIWIMIQSYGIRILDPGKLNCIDSIRFGEKGLLKNDCTDIKYGGYNRMFLKSSSGIIIYDYAEQRSVFFDKSNGYSYHSPKTFLYCNNHLFIGQSGEIEYYHLDNFQKFNLKPGAFLNTVFVDTTIVFTRLAGTQQKPIRLKWNQNNLSFSFSATEFFFPERIEYAYQLTGIDKHWQYTNSLTRKINYTRLEPGKYTFRLMAQAEGGNWNEKPIEYVIIIVPAFWQTTLFKIIIAAMILGLGYYFYRRRIVSIRKEETVKTKHEKELLELEAKALRAQMNPHFIFNSLNSIKSLINKNENDTAAGYLTTFSKLIRTLFQNSDKREVSLYEELETCKLYTQLEGMRFGDRIKFIFNIDDSLDLKDIKVPALILQPFIENAIWHGLVPKDTGGKVLISVKENNGAVECIIDDDGIGRELSRQYKAQYESTHQSKGIGLTQSRLELDKLLNEREDSINITDKKDKQGNSVGTRVIITFKENEK